MISNEEIQSWADDLTEEEPLKHALLELLAHRRAWSEPAEYQYRYHNHGNGCFGEWCRLYSGAQYEHMQKRHSNDNDYDFRTLYRKPSTE